VVSLKDSYGLCVRVALVGGAAQIAAQSIAGVTSVYAIPDSGSFLTFAGPGNGIHPDTEYNRV
jgi:hypothetical protein